MLTRKIDAGLDAIFQCSLRLPAMVDCYRPGTPERAALDELLSSLQRAEGALTAYRCEPRRRSA